MAIFPTTSTLLLKQRKLQVDYIRDSEPRTSLCRGWCSNQGLKTTMHKYNGLFIHKKTRPTEYISIDCLPWRVFKTWFLGDLLFFSWLLIPVALVLIWGMCYLSKRRRLSISSHTSLLGLYLRSFIPVGLFWDLPLDSEGNYPFCAFSRLSAQFWKVSVQRQGKMKQQSSQLQLLGPLNYL